MNHDVTHCGDYCDTCPDTCYRGQLTQDLINRNYQYPVSYAFFKNTEDCPLYTCCNKCKYKLDLKMWDYSQGGCVHSDEDGFVCMSPASDGVAIHMVGSNPSIDRCEMYKEKQ